MKAKEVETTKRPIRFVRIQVHSGPHFTLSDTVRKMVHVIRQFGRPFQSFLILCS